jgi:hypothetical protein
MPAAPENMSGDCEGLARAVISKSRASRGVWSMKAGAGVRRCGRADGCIGDENGGQVELLRCLGLEDVRGNDRTRREGDLVVQVRG